MGLMDKAKDAMSNEETSDKVLDKGEQFADSKAAGHEEQIDKGRDLADDRIGQPGDGS